MVPARVVHHRAGRAGDRAVLHPLGFGRRSWSTSRRRQHAAACTRPAPAASSARTGCVRPAAATPTSSPATPSPASSSRRDRPSRRPGGAHSVDAPSPTAATDPGEAPRRRRRGLLHRRRDADARPQGRRPGGAPLAVRPGARPAPAVACSRRLLGTEHFVVAASASRRDRAVRTTAAARDDRPASTPPRPTFARARSPSFDPDGTLRRAAAHRVRPPRRRGPGLPRLHRRRAPRRQPDRRPRRAAAHAGCSATRTRTTRRRWRRPRSSSGPAGAVLRVLQRPARRVPLHLHRQRQRGAAARRRVVPVRRRAARSPSPSTTTTRSTASASSPAARAPPIAYVPVVAPELRLDRAAMTAALAAADPSARNLLAFPAQSNFSGVQHPLDLVDEAHAAGLGRARRRGRLRPDQPARRRPRPARLRDVLLLQDVRLPDRRRLPAGAPRPGRRPRAAVVRRRHDHDRLGAGRRPLPARRRGGVRGRHRRLPQPAGRRRPACDHLERIGRRRDPRPGRRCLTAWLLDALDRPPPRQRPAGRRRSTGRPTPSAAAARSRSSMRDRDGRPIDDRRVEELANRVDISLRTGCFCNPGAGEIAHHLGAARDDGSGSSGTSRCRSSSSATGCSPSTTSSSAAIRISVGVATNFADVYRFMCFLQGFVDRTVDEIGRLELRPTTARSAPTPPDGHDSDERTTSTRRIHHDDDRTLRPGHRRARHDGDELPLGRVQREPGARRSRHHDGRSARWRSSTPTSTRCSCRSRS